MTVRIPNWAPFAELKIRKLHSAKLETPNRHYPAIQCGAQAPDGTTDEK
jgi:hypothetical protein